MSYDVNNTENVSTGKGIAGGYFFSAPRTTALIAALYTYADFTVPLDASFVNLGFVSSDGIVESESVDTNTDTDMNGDPINTSRSNRTETEKIKLVEQKRDALAEQYGHSNVSLNGNIITVHHNNVEREHRVYVAELVLKDGRRWRKIIPDGQITEIADLTINSSTLLGREATVSCNACSWVDGNGLSHTDTVIDFIQAEPPEPPQAPKLASLSLGGGSIALGPAFDPDVHAYTATTPYANVQIAATAPDGATAMLTVNGDAKTLGTTVSLDIGTNSVVVTVTDNTTGLHGRYAVSLTRTEPPVPKLGSLVLNGASMTPAFSPDTTSYTATTTEATCGMYYVVAPNSAMDTNYPRLNGDYVANGTAQATDTLALGVGENRLIFKVRDIDDSFNISTYTVAITRSE